MALHFNVICSALKPVSIHSGISRMQATPKHRPRRGSPLSFLAVSMTVANWLLTAGTTMAGDRVTQASAEPRFFVAPCSASLRLGRVSLVVTPLTRVGTTYTGTYRLKVLPYFYKNGKGTLVLDAPDNLLKQLGSGRSVNFVGRATNAKNGKVKTIKGEAIPLFEDKGSVTFSINTEVGLITFKTTYWWSGTM